MLQNVCLVTTRLFDEGSLGGEGKSSKNFVSPLIKKKFVEFNVQVISKYNYLAIKQIKSKYMGQECNLLMSDSIEGDTHFNKLPLAIFGLPWQRKLLQTFCAVKNIVRSIA